MNKPPTTLHMAQIMIAEKVEEKATLLAQGLCPKCRFELVHQGGCSICMSCGWTACSN